MRQIFELRCAPRIAALTRLASVPKIKSRPKGDSEPGPSPTAITTTEGEIFVGTRNSRERMHFTLLNLEWPEGFTALSPCRATPPNLALDLV